MESLPEITFNWILMAISRLDQVLRQPETRRGTCLVYEIGKIPCVGDIIFRNLCHWLTRDLLSWYDRIEQENTISCGSSLFDRKISRECRKHCTPMLQVSLKGELVDILKLLQCISVVIHLSFKKEWYLWRVTLRHLVTKEFPQEPITRSHHPPYKRYETTFARIFLFLKTVGL